MSPLRGSVILPSQVPSGAGLSFVMIVSPYFAESVQRQLEDDRVRTYVIGEVRSGEQGVEWVNGSRAGSNP